MKRKIKKLKKLVLSKLPKIKAYANTAFQFIYAHKEFALLIFIAYRLEELHAKFDTFAESLGSFLVMFYSKVADSIEFTQTVFLYFLSILGVES